MVGETCWPAFAAHVRTAYRWAAASCAQPHVDRQVARAYVPNPNPSPNTNPNPNPNPSPTTNPNPNPNPNRNPNPNPSPNQVARAYAPPGASLAACLTHREALCVGSCQPASATFVRGVLATRTPRTGRPR